MNKDRRILICVLGISLILRLSLWGFTALAGPKGFFTNDSPRYHENALSLLKLHRFSESPGLPDKPEALRTPGYPAFLAVTYFVLGENPSAAIAVQVIVGLINMILIYFIARQLWGSRVAILAVILSALDFGPFAFSLLLMTETLFILLMLCMLATLIPLARGEEARKWSLLAGLLLGLAALIRPVGYYLGFLLMFGILILGLVQHWRFKTASVLFCFGIPFFVITGSWQVRNYLLTGHPQLSSLEGRLIASKAAEVVAMKENIKVKEARRKISGTPSKEKWENGGFSYLRKNPLNYLSKVIARSFKLFAPSGFSIFRFFDVRMKTWPVRDLMKSSPGTYFRKWIVGHPVILVSYFLMCFHLMFLYTMAVLGIRRLRKNGRVVAVHFLFGLVFLYFLMVSLAIGFRARFLLPAMPILTLYSAFGFDFLLEFRRSAKLNRATLPASAG